MRVQPKPVWLLTTLGLIVISVVVTAVVTTRVVAASRQSAPPLVVTGDDPAKTPCVQDVVAAAKTAVDGVLELELLYSARCTAGWARVTRLDDAGFGNQIKLAIYRRSDPDGPTRQEAVEPDVGSAYTTLVVRTSPTDRLCAIGSVIRVADEVAAQTICV